MRCAVAALLSVSLAACFSASDPVAVPEPGPPADVPRVLGGVAVCDSCAEVAIDVAGPGLLNVTAAAVLSRESGHAPIRADVEARRFTGDSGTVLRVRVRFTELIAPGAYDLRLDTPGANAPSQAVVLPSALLVKRAVAPDQSKRPTGLTGTLRVTVAMTGLELDSSFTLIDVNCGTGRGCSAIALAPGITTDIVLSEGRHRLFVSGLERNCTAPGNGFVGVNVTANAVVELRLDVACTQYSWATVTVTASGSGIPPLFTLGCIYEPCGAQSAIPGGPAVLLKLRPGMQGVWLSSSNPFCTISENGTHQFEVAPGDTVALAFHAECKLPGILRLGVRFVGTGRDASLRAQSDQTCGYDFLVGEYWCLAYQIDNGEPVEIQMIGQSLEFRLTDLDPSCTVVGPTTLSGYVGPGQTVELIFDVDCS